MLCLLLKLSMNVGQLCRDVACNENGKIQQIKRKRLAMAVQVQGVVYPAIQDTFDHEIHGRDGWQDVARDTGWLTMSEPLFHRRFGELFNKDGEKLVVPGDDADI